MEDSFEDEHAPMAGRIEALRFELFVGELHRSIRFYREVLSFVQEPAQSDGYVSLTNHGVRLGLSTLDALPSGHYFRKTAVARLGVGVEIVLEVADLASFVERAEAMNAIFEPVVRRPWGLADFRVVDPDGYYIRVTTTASPSQRHGKPPVPSTRKHHTRRTQ